MKQHDKILGKDDGFLNGLRIGIGCDHRHHIQNNVPHFFDGGKFNLIIEFWRGNSHELEFLSR